MNIPEPRHTNPSATGSLDLPAIRLHVLRRMCSVWAMLGGLILAIVATDDLMHGRYGTVAFYTSAYALVVVCLMPQFLPYSARSIVPLLALYAVGSYEIFFHGLNSAGNLFYFALILFTCVLQGARAATFALVVSLVSMCVLTYSYHLRSPGSAEYASIGEFFHRQCLPDVVSLSLLASMAITFLSFLLSSLERSVEASQGYLAEIARERNHLIRLIEERDQVERQLRQAQKLEAVGQLAGGIAHDFNNLLQVVCAHTDILLRKAELGTSQHDQLNEIRKASERAAALTRQLLAYSRQQVMAPEYLDLNGLIVDFMSMLHRVIPEHIEIQLRPGADLGTVHADPRQLDQVLLNLCLNARDAMPMGGVITLETTNAVLDEAFAEQNPWAEPGAYVHVVVRDTGTGIGAAVQDHLFEPFFTTKKLGEGTGLGLSMAYGIVKQHGGFIHAQSEADAGAAFHVYLPLVDRPPQTLAPVLAAPPARGTETILLAEDDESVRDLIIGVLEGAGFTVIPAKNGAEAFSLFEAHQDRVDLLLFDIVMPRMGGKEACLAIRALRPEIRALFMSGYAPEGFTGQLALGKGTGFIQKPYRTQELLEKVRETLEA